MMAEGNIPFGIDAAIDALPDVVVVKDAEGRYVLINAACASVMGRRPEEVVGRTDEELFPPHIAVPLRETDQQVIETGVALTLTEWVPHAGRGGALSAWSSAKAPLRDETGKIVGLILTAREETSRAQATADREFLFSLGSALQNAPDVESLLACATQSLAQHLDVTLCGFTEIDAVARRMTIRHTYAHAAPASGTTNDGTDLTFGQVLEDRPAPIVAEEAAGNTVVVNDTRTDPRTSALSHSRYEAIGVRALISAPLIRQGRLVASLAVTHAQPRAWEPRDVELVRAVAERLWPAFEALNAFEAERKARARTERLQSLTSALARARTLEEVADVVLKEGVAASGASAAALTLRRRDALAGAVATAADDLEMVAITGLPSALITRYRRYSSSLPTPTNHVLKTGEPLFIGEQLGDEGLLARFPDFADEYRRFGARALATVPLAVAGQLIGTLTYTFASSEHFSDERKAFLLAFGQQAAQAVDRAQLLTAEQEARREVERLQRVTAAFAAAATVEEVAQAVVDGGRDVAGSMTGVLALLHGDPNDSSAHFTLIAMTGLPPEAWRPFRRFENVPGLPFPDVVRSRSPIFTPDRASLAARWPAIRDATAESGIVASASLPLVVADSQAGRVLGALSFDYSEAQRFDAATRARLTSLATLCAQALDRVMAHERAEAERVRAEAERAQAVAANAAKGQFLANMSHELRTPLNAIAGHAQLMEMELHGPLTELQRNALARIGRAQTHLLGLINDVLNYAKLEAGKVEFESRPVEVVSVVRSVASMMEPQVEARGLRLTVSLPGAAPDEDLTTAMVDAPAVRAWGDEEKLAQVLLNLLANAIKFTPSRSSEGKPDAESAADIHVALREGPDKVCIEVHDSGIGIPPEKQETIFEPFVQVNVALTRTTQGTGLGLAISRDLVRGMGGELHVSSALGEGSTFTVELRRVVMDS